MGLDGGGQQLDGVVGKLEKVAEVLGAADEDPGPGGANPRVSGIFFKAIFQAVLIFKLETWVLTLCIERSLGSIQYRVARRITGKNPKRREEGAWECLPLATAMEEAGFE